MENPDDPEDFNELEMKITRENLKSAEKTTLICPQCHSNNVTYYMGLKLGVQYQCKDCDYIGSFVIECDKD